MLAPVAQALDCTAELENIRDIVARGASYQRQLLVAAANDGSLKAVVSSLVRELQRRSARLTRGHPTVKVAD